MSIFPLPQFEEDLAAYEKDKADYEKLSTPKTMVVRFGRMRMIGEYPYNGDAKPGCGSKIVVRTHRGTELGELLTSTCPNAGCSKSVTRKEMLDYIENSGGKDYPFYSRGKALRVASIEDLNEQRRLEALAPQMRAFAQEQAKELGLDMKVVDAEPILGGERLTFYFMSEDRIDFRELVTILAREYSARIEMRQVGARDEARITADYERCGQHCCCKQFLKVLKPVSMRSAKQQKATLDPLKISGRCGRLMCCLRYEDQTYHELNKRLPKMKKRVGTPHGVGVVVDRQILTQLVLVSLEDQPGRVAVAAEDCVPPDRVEEVLGKGLDPLRGMDPAELAGTSDTERKGRQDRHRGRSKDEGGDADSGDGDGGGKKKRRRRRRKSGSGAPEKQGDDAAAKSDETGDGEPRKKKRRRRRRKGGGGGDGNSGGGGDAQASSGDGGSGADGGGKKKRRRRRRRRSGGGDGGSGGGSGGESGGESGGGSSGGGSPGGGD